MVSVLIASRNEVYLEKTIRNILDNAEGEIEVLVALDGYLPDPPLDFKDPRVVFYPFDKSIGQRQCINFLADVAKGEFLMKLDAHCAVDKGFDVKLAADCDFNWIVIPRMYNLDIATWQPKLHKRTDYMYIGTRGDRLMRAEYYTGREYRKIHAREALIDDTMCCMGPGWFLRKDFYQEIGGLDEGHGGWGQMGVELGCKAWLSGGAMKVNKKTWFAHWFRGGGGPGFPYEISGDAQERAREYSRDLWLNNKWEKQVHEFQWLVDKFKVPTQMLTQKEIDDLNYTSYQHVHKGRRYPRWRGHNVLKDPADMIIYQQVIFENKPDFIIETGTKYGGSANFLADICELMGHGQVISIDIAPKAQPPHKRITYITGDSIDKALAASVAEMVKGKKVMLILDSKHTCYHVQWELYRYSNLVTPGQYIVIEDCYNGDMTKSRVMDARDWFLQRTQKFELVNLSEQFLIGLTRDGWLRRK